MLINVSLTNIVFAETTVQSNYKTNGQVFMNGMIPFYISLANMYATEDYNSWDFPCTYAEDTFNVK